MQNNDRTEMLRTGEIGPTLLKLSIPAVIGMLVNAIYNVVDTAFIGLLNDTAAIGASAVLFPAFMLIAAIGLTFGIGAASLISRKLGEREIHEARKVAATAFYTSMIVGILFAVFGTVFIKQILIIFGATETILEKAIIYGKIIIGGSIFQILNMCLNNILRSEGAAKYSSIALMTGGIMNIILDPIFMFVLDLGLAGAAIATVTAQFISFLYLLNFFIRKKGVIRILPADFSPGLKMYSGIMAIGLPTFFRQILTSAALGMLNTAAGLFGDAAVAGIGIVFRVMSIIMMVIFGLGQGLQPLAGYNYGARQHDRVLKSVNIALRWSTLFAAGMAAVFMISARQVLMLFSRDPEVLSIGIKTLRVVCFGTMTVGAQVVYSVLFQALGKGRQAGILAMARQGLFFIPAIIILPGIMGITGVIITQPVADILALVVTLFMGISEMNKLKQMSETKQYT